MVGGDPEIVAWVSTQILPMEAELRHWLRRTYADVGEVDDLIQDIYFRLLKLPSVEHISEPKAYLYRIARNMVIDNVRKKTVVSIEAAKNLDESAFFDSAPSPERVALARAELRWALGLIAMLPGRCKRVFEMRKVYGLSQAETAGNLNLSENIVEKETARGLALISDRVAALRLQGGNHREIGPAQTLKASHVHD